jgi:hypothetical protein
VNNGDYGLYRCFVDFIGHEHIGGKTILYLIDGLWGSTNWAHPPIKWRMEPFNNDWPSSIFMSQDPVAIESVGFDFLFKEFDQDHPTEGAYDPSDNRGPFPHYAGTDDFLHQAADSENWPEGVTYDPENDGTPLPASMGVHEHWNNATDKQYSRNLGNDFGIELLQLETTGVTKEVQAVQTFDLHQNYPNPFNPTTTIAYEIAAPSQVRLVIYNTRGQRVRTLINEAQSVGLHEISWDGLMNNGLVAPSGIYFCKIVAQTENEAFTASQKMILSR